MLVNHYSASASEIVSACLQDHKRAVVIGERTWGKGSVQNVIELEGGKSALKLTTASYHRPSGKNIHRFPDAKDSDEWGVMPDAGFEVKLNPRQTERLIRERRQRDILVHHAKAGAAEPVNGDEVKPAESKPDDAKPAPEPKPDQPKPDQPKPDDAKPDQPKPDQPADKPAADAKGADTAKAGDAAKPGDAPAPFVDLQLQKAVDYLTQEMARAQ